jgi:flagellar motility protein MotE (MotC chaperone)
LKNSNQLFKKQSKENPQSSPPPFSSNIYSSKRVQLLMSENEILQKEQDRLNEIQTKILNEARKREQEIRKQVRRFKRIH